MEEAGSLGVAAEPDQGGASWVGSAGLAAPSGQLSSSPTVRGNAVFACLGRRERRDPMVEKPQS